MFSNKVAFKAFFLIILISFTSYLFISINRLDKGLLTVYFLDIGQGDSILIETPNGVQLLVDAGLNSAVVEKLSEVMPFYDKYIDAILMTHPDADHVGGFPEVLRSYDVEFHIKGNFFSENDISQEINKNINPSNIRIIKRGDKIILDIKHNIFLEILHPSKDFSDAESNDTSIMFRLVYGETEFMFTGDASKSVENFLSSQYKDALSSDVLKVGHHGSDTSTSDVFIGYVKPKYAVISAGKDNSYGHPHQEVLDRLKNFNVEVLQTKDIGTITMESDGEEVRIK